MPLNDHGRLFSPTMARDRFRGMRIHAEGHAVARARTTGVRVDNGCRYHLVFTAGRRKGDVWSVHLRLARGGQLLGSCFSFCRLAAASQTSTTSSSLPPVLPAQRAFPLGRTHMPLGPTGLSLLPLLKYFAALCASTFNSQSS